MPRIYGAAGSGAESVAYAMGGGAGIVQACRIKNCSTSVEISTIVFNPHFVLLFLTFPGNDKTSFGVAIADERCNGKDILSTACTIIKRIVIYA